LFQRSADVTTKVEEGSAELGITGLDRYLEYRGDERKVISLVDDLGYGRCDFVLAVPDAWLDVSSIDDLADLALEFRQEGKQLRIATKYPRLLRQYLFQRGINYFTLVAVSGALEAAPVAGYADQGGKGIIQGALDTGAFDKFYLPDGMISDSLVKAIGKGLEGAIGAHPGTDSPGKAKLDEIAKAAKVKSDSPFVPESYDAAALIMLAMEAAKSSESGKLKDKVMMVANAPGEKIYPGELAKALKILAGGGDVDYVGASAVELIGPGESAGNYRQITIKGGKIETVKYR